MKKIYRIIVLVISIFVGLSVLVYMINSPSVKIAFYDQVTEEDYQYLKDWTLKVAKTLDTTIVEENIRAYKTFDNQNLYITCELIQFNTVKCKVIATFPMLVDDKMLIKNDNIQITGKIDFEGVTYQEEETIKPLISQLMARCLISCTIVGLINVIFYYAPKGIKEGISWQKEQ